MLAAENIEWTKGSTLQLIELLKSHPCIWQSKHTAYRVKSVRRASLYSIARELSKSMNCVITSSDIMKKMHTLRSQYRREIRMLELEKPDAGSEEKNPPRLWCFQNLKFFDMDDIPHTSSSTIDVAEAKTRVSNVVITSSESSIDAL